MQDGATCKPIPEHYSAKTIVFSKHCRERLKQKRQKGLTAKDVVKAAQSINAYIEHPVKFRNFRASDGSYFSIVCIDIDSSLRKIITVIKQNQFIGV